MSQEPKLESERRPEWAKDLPPDSSAEYTVELVRRMQEGPDVRVRAVVEAFYGSVLSSINKGGRGGINVGGTKIRILSPQKYTGLELMIHHSKPPSDESCWRVAACVAEFDIVERQLEARQAGLRTILIYERELKNLNLAKQDSGKNRIP